MKKKRLSRKDLFWAGVTRGRQRERRELEMSGTRAPEVQQEIDEEIADEKRNAAVQIVALSERNIRRGLAPNVTLTVTYTLGEWYLELTDASSRRISVNSSDLGEALEEIFR